MERKLGRSLPELGPLAGFSNTPLRGRFLVRRQPNRGDLIMHSRSRTGAIVLIIVGTLFLLSNLGVVPQLGPLLRQWWPLILIVIGVIMLVQRS